MSAIIQRFDPPLEGILVRAIFLGGKAQEDNLFNVNSNFTENGALPDSSAGIPLVFVNTAIHIHAYNTRDNGTKTAVCSIYGSYGLGFICDIAATVVKPFGEQAANYASDYLKRKGLKICGTCKGLGMNEGPVPAGIIPDNLPLEKVHAFRPCVICHGQGTVPLDAVNVQQTVSRPAPQPEKPVPATDGAKVGELRRETGAGMTECIQALRDNGDDFERALAYLDFKKNQVPDLGGHSADCGGRPGFKGICEPSCPMYLKPELRS